MIQKIKLTDLELLERATIRMLSKFKRTLMNDTPTDSKKLELVHNIEQQIDSFIEDNLF